MKQRKIRKVKYFQLRLGPVRTARRPRWAMGKMLHMTFTWTTPYSLAMLFDEWVNLNLNQNENKT